MTIETETTLQHLDSFVKTYSPNIKDIADIGGAGYEEYLEPLGLKPKVYDPLYDESFDICSKPLPVQYSTVISCNTLEHVYDPIRACENMIASVKPGGYLFATTVFMYHQHSKEGYNDYFRFTDEAMKYMFRELECLECYYSKDNTSANEFARITYIGRKK